MTSTILTADRYIAIRFNDGSLSYNGILRILTKDGRIIPARWNAANCRLEACGRNSDFGPLPMYTKSKAIAAKLFDYGINFAWLTLDEAKEIAS